MGLGPSSKKLVYVVEVDDVVYTRVMNEERTCDRYNDSRIEEEN